MKDRKGVEIKQRKTYAAWAVLYWTVGFVAWVIFISAVGVWRWLS